MRKNSFERFYLEKVALGEGCGCAEHVTRIRELDALGERLAASRTMNRERGSFAWARRLARWVSRRKKSPAA